jgi:hypothetical protein
MPEWQLGRIGLARAAAAAGDLGDRPALLADVAEPRTPTRTAPWTDLVLVTAAEIERPAG